jgi:2-polyprenyl-6-hydroxyphenyl methylase/3-demethylubiquinone-9 3-methyltransferase
MKPDNITFSFGENWKNYIQTIDEDDISSANNNILDWISLDDIKDKDIIDIGCGSGLHSFCFHGNGARKLVSIDVDPNSVVATSTLKSRAGSPSNWDVYVGSILDKELLASLEQFDIVYSWGVLHHTGEMWKAIENAAHLVKPGGIFWISLYQKGPGYEKDLAVKQKYNNLSSFRKKLFISRLILKIMWKRLKKGRNPFAWNEKVARGMHKYHDIIDWYGGLPYEVASKEEVTSFLDSKSFNLIRVQERKERTCSIYLFKKESV